MITDHPFKPCEQCTTPCSQCDTCDHQEFAHPEHNTLDLPAEVIRLTKELAAAYANGQHQIDMRIAHVAEVVRELDAMRAERDAAIAALAEEASTVERMTSEAWEWADHYIGVSLGCDARGSDKLAQRLLNRARVALYILEHHPSYEGP